MVTVTLVKIPNAIDRREGRCRKKDAIVEGARIANIMVNGLKIVDLWPVSTNVEGVRTRLRELGDGIGTENTSSFAGSSSS